MSKRVAVIGAGWAGLSAAMAATDAGHGVSVFEASSQLGGRARSLPASLPNGETVCLDNGQHILIGAYHRTLAWMSRIGIERTDVCHDMPLAMVFPDGLGLRLPNWPKPFDALAGVLTARGWSSADKWAFLRTMLGWRMRGFTCNPDTTVATLCQGLGPRLLAEVIEPLCVSALNTPAERASASVFLRVLKDSLLGPGDSSHLLIPTSDLGALLPNPAQRWLEERGAQVHLGHRVTALMPEGKRWRVNAQAFDEVILAVSVSHAVALLSATQDDVEPALHQGLTDWLAHATALRFEAIATVYAWGVDAQLPSPLLALRAHPLSAPAQFVFDRGQLKGPRGLLAFVVSASSGTKEDLQTAVLAQAHAQLGLKLEAVTTVVEKRATFACTPGLVRPWAQVLPGLLACGDYIDGPYPATLEGAVRSGEAAAHLIDQHKLQDLPERALAKAR